MRASLAWHNLVHSKMRTAAAVAGVTFAVVLIFLQLGFLGAATDTASLIYGVLDFDVLLHSPRSRRLAESQPFPRSRLDQAALVAGVAAARPFYIGFHRWRIPAGPDAGYGRRILMMGARPGEPIFQRAEMQSKAALLTESQFALIDRLSRKDFGPRNGNRFGDEDLGTEVEVGYRRVQLVGHYALGASFEADGSLLVSDDGFLRIHPEWSAETAALGLIKLQPGADADAVANRLASLLPPDVEVLTRAGAIARERRMWLHDMSIGIVFQMGVAVALAVGAAIVYQILSSDVASHLPEYATLRAMGYRNGYLNMVVLQQALILSWLGFLPGLAISEGLYWLTRFITNIPIVMTVSRVLFVLVLSVAMCGLSGVAALRKLHAADPADLF